MDEPDLKSCGDGCGSRSYICIGLLMTGKHFNSGSWHSCNSFKAVQKNSYDMSDYYPINLLIFIIIGRYDPNRGLAPDYVPDSEFGDFLKAAHGYGFLVMAFVTFHGCSPNSPRYPEFEKYQLRHPIQGHKLGYQLNNPTYDYPTAYINPASKEFRKYVVEQMKTLYETYPIDAWHLDINTSVVNNPPIDGLTSTQGNVLLHQELTAVMPGIVLGMKMFMKSPSSIRT